MATKLDAAFLDRRMAEHKRWQHDALKELLDDVMDEMYAAVQTPLFARRAEAPVLPFPEVPQFTGRGPQKIARM